MQTALEQFLNDLDNATATIPLAALSDGLQRLEFEFDALQPYLRYHGEHYQRNLLRGNEHYHALLICWRAGQRSPIHDHRGSRCAFRVLHGTATESVFDRTPEGLVYPTETRSLQVGTVCASVDTDIHQVSNLQAADDLVTLHIYSPPLLVMGQYSLLNDDVSDFVDPIFEFSLGGGI